MNVDLFFTDGLVKICANVNNLQIEKTNTIHQGIYCQENPRI